MAQLSSKLRTLSDNHLGYWCQGCEMLHQVGVKEGAGPRWEWNGNVEFPTFKPSVLTQWYTYEPPASFDDLELLEKIRSGEIVQTRVNKICHTFITDGVVQFLGDCTHQFAGQTLPLPDLPKEWTDD